MTIEQLMTEIHSVTERLAITKAGSIEMVELTVALIELQKSLIHSLIQVKVDNKAA